MTKRLLGILAICVFAISCGGGKKPIVVGSKVGTEQTLLGEIAAQQLERRLETTVERRLGIGETVITHQSLISGQIDLYPEYTGAIASIILREAPNPDLSISYERTKAEMQRVAQAEFIGPLGFNAPDSVVVAASDAEKITKVSEAGKDKATWKIGVTVEFEQKSDGLANFNRYHIPMAAPIRSMDLRQLFFSLERKEITMAVVPSTDGHLANARWKILEDDMHLFSHQQAVLLARSEFLSRDERIRKALNELVGKFTPEIMRKLNARVELEHQPVTSVAADFLITLR